MDLDLTLADLTGSELLALAAGFDLRAIRGASLEGYKDRLEASSRGIFPFDEARSPDLARLHARCCELVASLPAMALEEAFALLESEGY